MTKGLVTLFGGSGFIGRYTARELVKRGYRVRIAVRRPNVAGEVRLAGPPGWVDIVQTNIRNKPSVLRALEGADAAINLVGILSEKGKQSFEACRDGAINIAEACAEKNITRLVQISATAADAESKSDYARCKGEADTAVLGILPTTTILRPSIVFGPEDGFYNRFAQAFRFTPVMPAIGGGKSKFQPIYAGDVANCIAQAVERSDAAGKTYYLGGPQTYDLNEVYDFVGETTDRKRLKVPLPFLVAKPMGYIFGTLFRYVPPFSWGMFGPAPFTGDQVEVMKLDSIVPEDALSAADLGVTHLESVESVVPSYLWRFRPYGQFHKKSEA